MNRTRPPRRGFTLVELLVSAALTILMMAVVAVAFQAALKAHSDLHSVSWLADQLRSANTILSRDLDAPHLWDDEAGKAVRVSEAPLYSTPGYVGWSAPHQHGFFHVRQFSGPKQAYKSPVPGDHYGVNYGGGDPNPYPYLDEGAENNKHSYRAGGHTPSTPPGSAFVPDHVLNMTVRLDADKPENAAAARAPTGGPSPFNDLVNSPFNRKDLDPTGTQFMSRWAEVSYFLASTPLFTSTEGQPPGTPSLPLYTLRRRQWVLTPQPFPLVHNPSNTTPDNNPSGPPPVLGPSAATVQLDRMFPEVNASAQPNLPYQKWFTNTPASVVSPLHRGGGARLNAAGTAQVPGNPFAPNPDGSDVLLSNVVSFQVRVMSEAPPLRPLPVVLPTADPIPSTPQWYDGYYVQPGTFHDLGLALEDHRYQPPASPPSYPAIYDTAASQHVHTTPPGGPHPPVPVGRQHIRQVRAIEITVRVYDFKTHLTRQITIKKDL